MLDWLVISYQIINKIQSIDCTVSTSAKVMDMKIGIIGVGQIGTTPARRFRAEGHEVAVANSRAPASLTLLARETDARAATAEEVVRSADLVVLPIPMKNVPSLPKGLFTGDPAGQIVVDTGNYYPRQRDVRTVGIEVGTAESDWVHQQIGRRVVKAFNSIFAQSLLVNGRPAGTPGRIGLAVAGVRAALQQARHERTANWKDVPGDASVFATSD
jgi:predicted dinucleotide-binding enzyme